jgi:hypothetical protein
MRPVATPATLPASGWRLKAFCEIALDFQRKTLIDQNNRIRASAFRAWTRLVAKCGETPIFNG